MCKFIFRTTCITYFFYISCKKILFTYICNDICLIYRIQVYCSYSLVEYMLLRIFKSQRTIQAPTMYRNLDMSSISHLNYTINKSTFWWGLLSTCYLFKVLYLKPNQTLPITGKHALFIKLVSLYIIIWRIAFKNVFVVARCVPLSTGRQTHVYKC